jgi:hypothetical protein
VLVRWLDAEEPHPAETQGICSGSPIDVYAAMGDGFTESRPGPFPRVKCLLRQSWAAQSSRRPSPDLRSRTKECRQPESRIREACKSGAEAGESEHGFPTPVEFEWSRNQACNRR